MRLVKLMLFAALAAGWWQLWHVRDAVTSAYTDERPALALELSGVGAVPIDADRPDSPYALHYAGIDRAPTFLPTTPAAAPDVDVSVSVIGGEANLSGTVMLPDGTPVAGATVQIERFTSEGQGTAETISGDDGSWTADGLLGGRFRVRAFAPNQLASIDPSVLVVARTGTAQLTLTVDVAADGLRFDMVGPPGIAIGAPGTAAIVISREIVDETGRLIRTPVASRDMTVSLTGARLLSADVVITDPGGSSRFLIACDFEGAPTAVITTSDVQAFISLPSCMTAEALAEIEAAAAEALAAEQEASGLEPSR